MKRNRVNDLRNPQPKKNGTIRFEQQCMQIYTKHRTTKNHVPQEPPPTIFSFGGGNRIEGRGLEANRSESRKILQAKKGLGPLGPGPSLLVSEGRANVSYSNQPQHGKVAVGIETNLVFSDIYQSLAMDPPTFVSTFLAGKCSLTLCITIGWIMLDRYCWLNLKPYIITFENPANTSNFEALTKAMDQIK